MASLSIAAVFAFMLVVATTTANPVHNEREEKLMTLNQDPVKALKNVWNEEVGKDRSAQAINLWNDIIEEDHNKNFYTMRDDGEDVDRDQKGDQDKEAMKLWNKGKVNNEGRFEAKIEHPVELCSSRSCSSASDCCNGNPTCGCRSVCRKVCKCD